MPFTPAHSATPNAGLNNVALNLRSTQVPASLARGERLVLVRSTASIAAADSGPWNKATWDPSTYGVACDAYDTVLVTAKFTGAGTVKVAPMLYDPDTQLWMSQMSGGAIVQSEALDGSGNQMAEVRVFGARVVFFRISTLAGGPLTNLELAIMRGAPRGVAYLG